MLAAQINFAQKVGVAPSTTTMAIGDAGLGIQCYPIPSPQERGIWLGKLRTTMQAGSGSGQAQPSPQVKPAPKRQHYLNPYASEVEMRGGLGVVNPNDAWRTGDVARVRAHGTTTLLFNPLPGGGFSSQLLGAGLGITNGEINRSLTGGLGTVPNDDELARNLCYTPVHSGWIYGNQPTGQKYYRDGLYGALAEDPGSLSEVVKIQRKQMILQGIATFAIVGLATASIWNAVKSSPKPVKRRRRR
jgi:hypothetical protein